jgi:hypothetical protein
MENTEIEEDIDYYQNRRERLFALLKNISKVNGDTELRDYIKTLLLEKDKIQDDIESLLYDDDDAIGNIETLLRVQSDTVKGLNILFQRKTESEKAIKKATSLIRELLDKLPKESGEDTMISEMRGFISKQFDKILSR